MAKEILSKGENMPEDLKHQLQELLESTKSLNCQTSQLNNKFVVIENKLADMKLGVSAWVNKPIGKKTKDNTAYQFGYCRVGTNWKLVCRKIILDDSHKKSTLNFTENYGLLEHITNMPRSVRIEASSLISELVESLLSKIKEFSLDINMALSNLESAESKMNSKEGY